MSYKFYLPLDGGATKEHHVEHNSVIIIGANGAGKSKLGAWIEKVSMASVHRIGAQRSLNFTKNVPLKSETQAYNLLSTGTEDVRHDKYPRWGAHQPSTLKLLHDYDHVLSLVFAKVNRESHDYIQRCKEHERLGSQLPSTPELITGKIIRIWNNVFSHLQIDLVDGTVKALKNMLISGGEVISTQFNGVEMSDGERVALYLIAQALCVPQDKTIIIDEPEIHLHRTIMNRLWNEIEKERDDCLFIYITHDVQFAAAHKQAQKIWVKNYYREKWDYEIIQDSDLPETLLLGILGNRKNVIFVEGTKDSYDTALYSEIYSNYHIVPCGSCSNVIANVKSFKNCGQLHHLKCYGIIDRDFRPDHEINALENDGIYALKVAEVENLFLVEEVLRCVKNALSSPDDTGINNVIKYIKQRFQAQQNNMIEKSIKSEFKFIINTFNFTSSCANTMETEFTAHILSKFSEIQRQASEKFSSPLVQNDYSEMLKVFNQKQLINSVGQHFNFANRSYCEHVLNFMRGNYRNDFINAIKLYLPTEIPIE